MQLEKLREIASNKNEAGYIHFNTMKVLSKHIDALLSVVEVMEMIAAQDPKEPADKPTRLGAVTAIARMALARLEAVE